MKPIGTKEVRVEYKYVPARIKKVVYKQTTYACPVCKDTDQPFFKKSLVPRSLFNHSYASPSLLAQVLYMKFVNSVPCYRQEKDWKQQGLPLQRNTMSNWIIKSSEEYFEPLWNLMYELLLQNEILMADETKVQVLREPGKTPQSNSYIWVYRTTKRAKTPIILYEYSPSRSGANARRFLNGFSGYLHTDGYSGYNRLPNVVRCGCLAHLRRKFSEIIKTTNISKKSRSVAREAEEYCNRLFAIEKELQDKSDQERYTQRQELEKPVLEAFFGWLKTLNVLSGSALGTAVKYALNQEKNIYNYLLDGRCEISNNASEQSVKSFVICRKNWLFSVSPEGAKANAVIMSLVETAKAHKLNLFKYLNRILEKMPDLDWHNDVTLLDQLLPWSEETIKECKS